MKRIILVLFTIILMLSSCTGGTVTEYTVEHGGKNYTVNTENCTITDGEAHFRDIFISCAYALVPMIIFQPIALILSNVLTFNEQFFITLINVVSIGWTGLLLVLVLMYQNDYTLKKTFATIFKTMFCVLVVVALIVVLYMLISQLVDFVVSIYGEVVYRFVKRV